MKIIKPPQPFQRSVFLAGSIEMGKAEDWQTKVTARLSDLDVTVMNPRRDAWDSSWKQSIDEPKFLEQVEWELDGLDRADVIAMWIVPETMSPITLLELGLHARGGRLVVGCPPGFWRRGNVEIVCDRYGITLAPDFEQFVDEVRSRLGAEAHPSPAPGSRWTALYRWSGETQGWHDENRHFIVNSVDETGVHYSPERSPNIKFTTTLPEWAAWLAPEGIEMGQGERMRIVSVIPPGVSVVVDE